MSIRPFFNREHTFCKHIFSVLSGAFLWWINTSAMASFQSWTKLTANCVWLMLLGATTSCCLSACLSSKTDSCSGAGETEVETPILRPHNIQEIILNHLLVMLAASLKPVHTLRA